MEELRYQPIGVFRCPQVQPVDSPRQGSLAPESSGWVELNPEIPVETLRDLEGFDRVWLIYSFNQNTSWNPMVRPPRGADRKRGVFATRSPYRPNGIGMSCVRLLKIEGGKLYCSEHDLLDQTPILDIKPYVVVADSFPEAKQGWLTDLKSFNVLFESLAAEQCQWISQRLGRSLEQIVTQQLSVEPTNKKIKRVKFLDPFYAFHYRTWKLIFQLHDSEVSVLRVESNYSFEDMESSDNPHSDKSLHREFIQRFKKTDSP